MAVIEVKDVWKKFRLYHDKRPTLKEKVLFRGRGKWEDFWALKGVNLSIEKGSTVGLIGQNGSGKSTLLKALTRIIYPNRGSIKIQGKVSSLLELGAGFHPDFTGRENIYMNASIFGLSKKAIDRRVDQIIDFSELEEFIDNPVRSYSSGMYMRLAFATAINVDPDVLLIDEVLAVGDANFQKKCLGKISEFKLAGKTIVIVSHDLSVIERLCDTAVWLHYGEMREMGNTRRVIDSYLLKLHEESDKKLSDSNKQVDDKINVEAPKESTTNDTEEEERKSDSGHTETSPQRWGTREIEITYVKILDGGHLERYVYESGEEIDIVMGYKRNKATISGPCFGIGIFRSDGICCYGTNTAIDDFNTDSASDKGQIVCKIKGLDLLPGSYFLDVAIESADGYPFDYQTQKLSFETHSKIEDIGVTRLQHMWKLT